MNIDSNVLHKSQLSIFLSRFLCVLRSGCNEKDKGEEDQNSNI